MRQLEVKVKKKSYKRIVLAYSGGLDTSVILKWLQNEYNAEVITYTADLGQKDEIQPAKKRAVKLGCKKIVLDDVKEEFVSKFVFPMLRANPMYEEQYLLGTAIARPLISQKLIETAKKYKADAIAHGSTGKGNDQIRFELSAYALNPKIKIIAPWREWNLNSRTKLLNYAKQNKIDFPSSKKNEPPYSMDANLLHISYEGKILEDPWKSPPENMWTWVNSVQKAPNKPTDIIIEFHKGDPAKINSKKYSPATILEKLNNLGAKNGVGRIDIVENRYIGMKSRGCYETPGGTIILMARRALEGITVDKELLHMKQELMPKYAKLIYNGYWWSPERNALQGLINESQNKVSGHVKLRLIKGNVIILGRKSENSIYNADLSTFEDDMGEYNQKDAEGFIKLNALRLKSLAKK